MIFVDALAEYAGPYRGKAAAQATRVGARNGHRWCHLFSNETNPTLPELHAFARRIGMQRAWFQSGRLGDGHYDLTPGRRAAALAAGAQELDRHAAVAVWRAQRVAFNAVRSSNQKGGNVRFVQQVKSNLKCGADAVLGPKTLVVGPNGAGKSALVNAVEAAGSGTVSDVAGRQTVTSDALVRLLIPPGVDEGHAKIVLVDGDTAEYSITPERGGVRTGAALAFPLREVYDNLLGNAETAQKWLLRHVGKGDLPTTVEVLKTKAREEIARAKALRSAATSQAGGLRPEPTAEEIAAMKAAGVADSLREAEQTLRDAEDALAAAEEKVRKATQARDALPAGNSGLVENGLAIVKIIDAQISANATSKCGLCAGSTTKDALLTRRTTVNDRIAQAKANAEAWTKADDAVKTATFDLGVTRSDAKRALEVVKALTAQAQGQEPAEVTRLKAAWDAVRKLQRAAEAAEASAATISARAKTAIDDMERESQRAVEAFEQSVQKFLPPGDVFGFAINPPRFGFKDGPEKKWIRSALSGAEWARVTAAIASAIAREDGPVPVVIPEERAFDPATLTEVLKAFSNVPAQVIVASPIEPTAIPEGWTVVRVGKVFEVQPVEERKAAAEYVEASRTGRLDGGPFDAPTLPANPSDPSLFDDDPPSAPHDAGTPTPPEKVTVVEKLDATPLPAPGAKPRRKKGESDEAYRARTGQEPPAQRVKKGAKPDVVPEAAPPSEPRRSVQPEGEGSARAEAAPYRGPHFCPACNAEIAIGACEHGVAAPARGEAAAPVDPSAFD
jgi:ABC-type branched-subunit amino acid transport system ATPase component/chorismate mutase